ncbi:DUF4340 domain-containing protein [Paraglaciecola sp. L3A3]|uniref:DUF4340 domain-containing protein n=1 Tax=Paraglaciecola sp. L3A3 TaxID=2686358 RepID=UPI00131B3698|nr:DUF4340 domain-containing protein [Paraglaciecola sp. L3A3]
MNKQLSVLSLLLLIAIGVGVWILQKPSYSEFESELLFADLSSVAADVDSVMIENSSGTLFKAVKSEDTWLAELGYTGQLYPVDKRKLANLINTLMQAKLIEAKTKLKQNHGRLGLQGINQEDSLARLVTIAIGTKTWQVLIGNQVNLGEGNYVRLPNENQSWRLDKNINLPIDQFSWFKHPILPYKSEDIVSVSRVDKHNWSMLYNDDIAEFTLEQLPDGRTLQYDGVLTGFVSSLTNIDYQEIISADEYFIQSLERETELNLVTKQNVQFKLIVSKAKDIYYLNFSSDNAQEYWQNYYYQVSTFSAQQLNKQVEDFLAEVTQSIDDNVDAFVEEGAPEN